ncbi:All-trans-nonaprenyl-diphosphate synthase [anaerobic digester metagenome]
MGYLMSPIDKIRKPIARQLDDFEQFFKESMKSKVPLLDIITNYIYRHKGKQLRPLLVFLSAGATGSVTQSTYTAAGMIELLHTATLIHDDVVDESYERRGVFSINALWRSKIAVLAGDFILSKGLLLAVETGEFELLKLMSNAVKEMSEGELLQIERSRKMNVDEATYFEIIRMKTATLLASCAANGAVSAGASNEVVDMMHEFGTNLGIAFQIRDDLFDYQPKGIIGKPTGNDIKEKKLTLPLIHALAQVSEAERRRILNLVRSSRRNGAAVAQVVDFVVSKDGLVYTEKVMQDYKQKAINVLMRLPQTACRDSLVLLTNYVVDRNK